MKKDLIFGTSFKPKSTSYVFWNFGSWAMSPLEVVFLQKNFKTT
jgi:hypothetical protein